MKQECCNKVIQSYNKTLAQVLMRDKVFKSEGVASYQYSADGKHGGNALLNEVISSDKSNLALSRRSYRYVIAFAR